MEDVGKLLFQQGILYFEIENYEDAVECWIKAYIQGYEKELILENIYSCFVKPNEQEFRKNYIQCSNEFTKLPYEMCMLDFIPVSEERFYIFDRESDEFQGMFSLEKETVWGKIETIESILYTDEWDIRKIIPDMKEYRRDTVYILLENVERKFVSFFKLPHFRERYLANVVTFPDRGIMEAFFLEYEEFYLPKRLVTSDLQKYMGLILMLHQKRVHHLGKERKNILLSICIPEHMSKEEFLRINSYLQKCPYDSEIEVIFADGVDVKDARIRCFESAAEGGYAANMNRALEQAKGRCKALVCADDGLFWERLGENLDFIKTHSTCTVCGIHGTKVGDLSMGIPDREAARLGFMWAIRENKDIFYSLFLRNQYIGHCFAKNIRAVQDEEWSDASYFMGEMQRLLGMGVEKIPLWERDKGVVVIATTQLLSPRHAPTRIVLEICRILEIYLKKRVFILSEAVKVEKYRNAGLRNLIWFNCRDELTGEFEYPYKECTFSGYQIILEPERLEEMKRLMRRLYSYKPYCVWCIGGMPVFAGAMKQFTSMIYTQCVEGYPGIPADIVANYFARSPAMYPQEHEFLAKCGVQVKDIRIGLPSYQKSKGIYKRRDFAIPEGAFCIGISGNRLEEDCTEEFLEVLRQAIQKEASKEVWLVFIGNVSEEKCGKIMGHIGDGSHVRFLGYCPAFTDAMALIDLLVATPGLGNGGSGVAALCEGKPVISLEIGDVASCVGKDFQCRGLDDYLPLIYRYIEDGDFYKAQSERAIEVFESLLEEDGVVAGQLQEVLELVEGA